MKPWLKTLRTAGLTFGILGAIVCAIINTLMSFPYIVLTLLLWTEKTSSRLIYLVILSIGFGLYGIPETFDRTYIHLSTLNGLTELMFAELMLLVPILAHRIRLWIRKERQHHNQRFSEK
jgi:hypothetical protein